MPASKYTVRTMPDIMFNNWMVHLRNFPHKQIYRNLHDSQGNCCAWGAFLQSVHGPGVVCTYDLLTSIGEHLYIYVMDLNDKDHMPFTEIADKLEANRKRAIAAYTTRQNAAIYADLCNS